MPKTWDLSTQMTSTSTSPRSTVPAPCGPDDMADELEDPALRVSKTHTHIPSAVLPSASSLNQAMQKSISTFACQETNICLHEEIRISRKMAA